jgi:hypothetical protein
MGSRGREGVVFCAALCNWKTVHKAMEVVLHTGEDAASPEENKKSAPRPPSHPDGEGWEKFLGDCVDAMADIGIMHEKAIPALGAGIGHRREDSEEGPLLRPRDTCMGCGEAGAISGLCPPKDKVWCSSCYLLLMSRVVPESPKFPTQGVPPEGFTRGEVKRVAALLSGKMRATEATKGAPNGSAPPSWKHWTGECKRCGSKGTHFGDLHIHKGEVWCNACSPPWFVREPEGFQRENKETGPKKEQRFCAKCGDPEGAGGLDFWGTELWCGQCRYVLCGGTRLPDKPLDGPEISRFDNNRHRTVTIHNLTDREAEIIIAHASKLLPGADHQKICPFQLFQREDFMRDPLLQREDFMSDKVVPPRSYGRQQGREGETGTHKARAVDSQHDHARDFDSAPD